MASKIFSQAPKQIARDEMNLRNMSLTAVLVEAEPPVNLADFGSLTNVCSGGNYNHIYLQNIGNNSDNRIVDRTGGGIKLVMQAPSWVALSTSTNNPIPGVVIIESSSSTPGTSSRVLCYLERTVGGTPTAFIPNGSDTLIFDFATNGILQFY